MIDKILKSDSSSSTKSSRLSSRTSTRTSRTRTSSTPSDLSSRTSTKSSRTSTRSTPSELSSISLSSLNLLDRGSNHDTPPLERISSDSKNDLIGIASLNLNPSRPQRRKLRRKSSKKSSG